jgi:hypothetical protein
MSIGAAAKKYFAPFRILPTRTADSMLLRPKQQTKFFLAKQNLGQDKASVI